MPHYLNFDLKLTSDAKIQRAVTGRKDSCFRLFSPWPHSTSNFCALIGQNLTGEFMEKIYAASWNLFTLTAEADRVLCQPVMFLIVFFIGFWLRNASLVKVGNPISDDIVFVFHRSWCVRGLKSLERFWPYLIAFRSSIRNGKPE